MDGNRPTRAADQPTLVGGRYRIGDLIARGGMASVYRAHDEQLDRPVAVKLMRPELAEDPGFTARFEAEARSAASVGHPNVVSIYDVGTDEDVSYIVMELVEGGDVAGLIARERPLKPTRAAQIAADAASALQAAHDAGVVHRDVKPGNILLRADGRATVADFGIARATGEGTLTKTGAMLGSVDYFSPEQARGERADERSDVYGLGVVLYELLTGRRPFGGDSPYAVATARIGKPPPDPRAVAPEVPAGVAEITMRAMAEAPADRFPTAASMRDELLAWLEAATEPADGKPGTTVLPAGAVGAAPVELAIEPSAPARPAAARPAAAPEPAERRRGVPAWAPILLLVLLVGGGYLAGRVLVGGEDPEDVLPEVVLGPIGGQAFDASTPTPTASAAVSPSVTAVPTPTEEPADTPAPATPAATPRPPAATPVPPPASTPVAVALAGPDDAVAAFYAHVVDARFDDAYDLWSSRMRSNFDRGDNLDGRFDETADITFSSLYTASQSDSTATVQANFTETYDSGASRQFIGYWQLVRVDGRWLLDWPTY